MFSSYELKPDWSNWVIFADRFKAMMNTHKWGHHIDPRSPTYLPPPGLPGTPEQDIYLRYTEIEGIATRKLIDLIPASIHSQIGGEETLLKKWEKLKELCEANAQKQAIASAMANDEAPICVTDGGREATISSYTEEKSIIIGYLKHCKYTPDTSVLSHLTLLKVLREGLVQRRSVLSDSDFLEYVRDSFPPGSQYQNYLKAVTTIMQRGQDDNGSQGGDQMPKLSEVFLILVELEKQEKGAGEAQVLIRKSIYAAEFDEI